MGKHSFVVDIFLFLAQWILVPAVLIALFALSVRLTQQGVGSKRPPRIVGFLLGMSIFIVVIVSTQFLGTGSQAVTTFTPTGQGVLSLLGIGLLIGGALMFLIDFLAQRTSLPLFICILTAASLAGLYYYILTIDTPGPVILIVLGLLVGALAYLLFNPKLLGQLFP